METDLREYFMGIALLCEKRSKDKSRQVGACIVDKNDTVISTGYNGMPLNCHDSVMSWAKKEKHDYVCHAEMNAIVNMDPKSVKGCTLYATLYPCNECAKAIVRSGIEKVVYLSDDKAAKPEFQAAKEILKQIKQKQFQGATKAKLDLWGEMTKQAPESQTSKQREDQPKQVISWSHFFMSLAKLTAEMRSENPSKEGACVVNGDNRIIGLGHVYDMVSSASSAKKRKVELRTYGVCHAPVAAIINKNPTSLRGCTLFVTQFPCKECAKVIIQSGIHKVIYMNKTEKEGEVDPATRMFAIAHIEMEQIKESYAYDPVYLDYAIVQPDN